MRSATGDPRQCQVPTSDATSSSHELVDAIPRTTQAAVKRYESEAQALGELLVARSEAYCNLMPQASTQGALAEVTRAAAPVNGEGGGSGVGDVLGRVVNSLRQVGAMVVIAPY